MVAVWAFAAVGALLVYYVTGNYDRWYGYFLFFFPYYLGPALILSVIGLWVRHRLCKGVKGNA
jgi:purine-cytosine permease-like protein